MAENMTTASTFGTSTALSEATTALPPSGIGTGYGVILVVTCVVTFVLNIALCGVVVRYPRLHSRFFFYVVSAGVSDCLRVATVMSLSTVRLITGSWTVNADGCAAWYFLFIFFTTNTLCHIGFMSADLYFNIKDPIKSKLSNHTRSNIFHIVRAWLTAAGTTGVPYLVFYLVPNGHSVKFLGCGHEKMEYVLCSVGLCILLPIIVLIIINSASLKAVQDKNSLISRLDQKDKKREKPESTPTKRKPEPVQERYVRRGSFYNTQLNQDLPNPQQIIQIQITDPDDNTTDYVSSPARGVDNPAFVHDDKSTVQDNIEMAVMNGQAANPKQNTEPTNNNKQTMNKTITGENGRNNTTAPLMSSEMMIIETDNTTVNNGVIKSGESESPELYFNQVYEMQFLRICSRMVCVRTKLILLVILTLTFLVLNLPFYILNVVYVLCSSCQADISQTLIWIFKWLTFSTSLIHPILYLIFLLRIGRG